MLSHVFVSVCLPTQLGSVPVSYMPGERCLCSCGEGKQLPASFCKLVGPDVASHFYRATLPLVFHTVREYSHAHGKGENECLYSLFFAASFDGAASPDLNAYYLNAVYLDLGWYQLAIWLWTSVCGSIMIV